MIGGESQAMHQQLATIERADGDGHILAEMNRSQILVG